MKKNNHEEAQQSNASSNELLDSVAHISKVNKEKSFNWVSNKFIWIIAGVILVVLFMMLLSGNQKTDQATVKQASAAFSSIDSQAVLSENLAEINQMNTQKEAQIRTLNDSVSDDENSKAYLARQNAPTTMYSAAIKLPVQHQSEKSSGNGNPFIGKSGYANFGNQATIATSVSAQRIAHPRYTIANGEFIHAVLETAIDSDLPGQLRAVISRPVYAYVGERPLIPAGSRLIGQYSSAVLQGQDRVFVVWSRVILPNGISVQLNSPGIDALGRSGIGADYVDTHFFTRFGEAALLSIIGAGVSNLGVSSNDQYNSGSQYRMAIAQSFQHSANNTLKSSMATKPTIHVFQGAAVNVFVAHDLDFYDVKSSFKGVASANSAFVYRGDHG